MTINRSASKVSVGIAGLAVTGARALTDAPGYAAPATDRLAATCHGVAAKIVGTAASDEIDGTRHRDVIVGRGGSDDIEARGGDDLVCGGRGRDELEGDAGNDTLRGGAGNDELEGDRGADRLFGGLGFDHAEGGFGNDLCRAEIKRSC